MLRGGERRSAAAPGAIARSIDSPPRSYTEGKMKTPLTVHRSLSIALLVLLAALVTGCATQPDRPQWIIERDAVRADGKEWKKCKSPKDLGTLPDCKGLRGVTVQEVKALIILRSLTNPTCEVYFWEGWYWEYCW
jgi:hypothetical protein